MTKHSAKLHDSVQAGGLKAPPSAVGIPWWVSIIVILGALLTISGAVISKLAPTMLTNSNSMTEAARIYADYMFARNLPLALMLLLLLALKARQMLAGFMLLTALIQFVDVLNNLARGAFLLVPGLLVFVIVFLIGAWKLFGQPIWHADTWHR